MQTLYLCEFGESPHHSSHTDCRNAKKHMDKNDGEEPSTRPRSAPKAAAKKAAAAPAPKRRRRS